MPAVFLSPFGNGQQFFDDNGDTLASGAVNTYAAGTSTPTATYTDSTGNTLNANPIPLNAAGRIATQVWLPQGGAVRFVPVSSVSTAAGVAQDNIYGINDPTTINGIGYTGATVSGALIMNLAPINEAQGANIPVAAQINLTTATGNYLQLTGSGTVTAVQLSQGAYRELVSGTVSAAFQNSTTLIMIGGGSYTPASGDILGFRGEGVSGIVRNVLLQRASGLATSTTPTPLASVSNSLAANVSLANTTTFVTSVTVQQGAVGAWFASGKVTVQNTGTASTTFRFRLSDGTTIVDSTAIVTYAGSGSVPWPVSLSGVFNNPVDNISIFVQQSSNPGDGFVLSNASAQGRDSTLTAVRIG